MPSRVLRPGGLVGAVERPGWASAAFDAWLDEPRRAVLALTSLPPACVAIQAPQRQVASLVNDPASDETASKARP